MTGVALGYVHGNEVAYSWHRSVRALEDTGLLTAILETRYGTGDISEARNTLVRDFLAGPETWLFWTDVDMGFAPDALARLMAHGQPIVGALTFAAKEVQPDGLNGYEVRPAPVLFRWAISEDGEQQGFTPWLDYPRDQLVQVAGTGGAVILVHRSAYETIGGDWYSPMRSETSGGIVSEDLSFCARAARAGVPVHVDTSVKTSHNKMIWISESSYAHPGGS